ncbi:MAG: hypothetical protein MUO38_09815, partial [Anaerolineales bacterium]|nr:hypothetical protein [Anaerolineales bacterium]
RSRAFLAAGGDDQVATLPHRRGRPQGEIGCDAAGLIEIGVLGEARSASLSTFRQTELPITPKPQLLDARALAISAPRLPSDVGINLNMALGHVLTQFHARSLRGPALDILPRWAFRPWHAGLRKDRVILEPTVFPAANQNDQGRSPLRAPVVG